MQVLIDVGAQSVEVIGDSLLVIKQLSREFECRDDSLRVYWEDYQQLLEKFILVDLCHVPMEQNMEANDLAQIESGYRPIEEVADLEAGGWRREIVDYLQEPSRSAPRKLRYKALKYVLLDGELYYRMIDGVLLKCLNMEEAKVVMCEVHDGICGTHQSAHKMKWLIRRAGYFWPNTLEECFTYYKGC